MLEEPSEYSICHIDRTPDAFALDPLEFEKQIGIPKPDSAKELIFYCASGKRGGEAQKVASSHGIFKHLLYPGSVNDWVLMG
nr:AEL_HP1_G0051660.mRNA.1.CDS.1 [Saccharomyces cerevisiae]